MSSGKAIAQAGHAYLDAMLTALAAKDPQAAAYASLFPGTKITLDGGSESDLLRLRDKLSLRGIPHALIVDQDHVEPPDFDGSPTITALGIGPLTRKQARKLLSRQPLWGAPARRRAP